MHNSPWIQRRDAATAARIRLFCFPYAGGGASVFRDWWGKLPPEVDLCPVQLPGREKRITEPPATCMETLIEDLHTNLAPWFDLPSVLFGHSMGASIAFELAQRLQTAAAPPKWLFVSGRGAPQLPLRSSPRHTLSEDEFLAHLRRRDTANDQVFQHNELREIFLPILRADYTLIETRQLQQPAFQVPLDCPITAFGGARDEDVPEADIAAWSEQTNASFRPIMLPGGHFFLRKQLDEMLNTIKTDLAPWLEAPN